MEFGYSWDADSGSDAIEELLKAYPERICDSLKRANADLFGASF